MPPHDDRRSGGFNPTQVSQMRSMVTECVAEKIQARSDEELEDIAEKAATKAIAKLTDEAYRMVGKSILEKLYWMVGALVVGAYLWADHHGWLGKP